MQLVEGIGRTIDKNQQQPVLLELRNVRKEYQVGDGTHTALNNICLQINQGEFLGITGKSGAGKTTLLNMISGVSTLTSGEILFHDRSNGTGLKTISVHNLNEDDLALWRGRNVGIVYQSFELIPSLTLVENIMFPHDLLGTYDPIISKAQALKILEDVELLEHAYKLPAQISGGQKQRVAISRALVNEPDLIIADEPTGNLDTVTAERILGIFERLVASGRTIIMVTHDASMGPRFSRQLHIVDGEIGSPPPDVAAIHSRSALSRIADEPATGTVPDALPRTSDRAPRPRTAGAQQHAHPAIVLRDVRKVFQGPAGEFVALKSVDMKLNYGQFISVVGKSGSGKSTLLNMITGIDHPTAGEVIVGNERIYDMNESKRALWRGRHVGVVFQFFQLLPTLTLLENTILPMDYCDVYPFQERPMRAMDLLEQVGLKDFAHQLPGSVSTGQQQTAAIARALANDPSIILADEPTGNLDSRSARKVLDLFEELADSGKTIMIVTHDPSITQRTDQTVILSDGEVVDQTIAGALPLLSHPQMLSATHLARRQNCAPNSLILREGDPVDNFYMIVNGEVEVLVGTNGSHEMSLACLGPGQFFGEVELTQGGTSIASVRAAAGGSEVALLPKEAFCQLINGSPSTRNALQDIARTRMMENMQQKSGR